MTEREEAADYIMFTQPDLHFPLKQRPWPLREAYFYIFSSSPPHTHNLPSYHRILRQTPMNCQFAVTKPILRYGLDGRVSISGRDKVLFSSPQRPDRLWGPSTPYLMGTGGKFLGGLEAGT